MTKWGMSIALVGALLVTGCSGGEHTTPKASPGAPPKTAPADALRALLTDEQRGDHAASYALLDTPARATYRDVDDWSHRRDELPSVTGFSVASTDAPSAKGDSVVAVVDHEPGLDPFIGLSPARTRETWTAHAERGAWRFDAEPVVHAILPGRGGAVAAARAWATSVQSCNESHTATYQAVTTVFGTSVGADALCGERGTVAAHATTLPIGPATADLVSQYTSDALSWATAVHITGVATPFSVVLAPIGNDWKVVSVFDG